MAMRLGEIVKETNSCDTKIHLYRVIHIRNDVYCTCQLLNDQHIELFLSMTLKQATDEELMLWKLSN